VQGDQGDVTLATGGAAGMLMWLGPISGFPTFEEIVPGLYSACVVPITGSIMDQQFIGRVFANLDKLEVVCKAVTVGPSPAKQETSVTVPAMKPLPAEDEGGA
jgi:hypothetical protein